MNIVWSKPMCPFCDMAKSLLTMKGIEFEERKLGDGWTKEQLGEVEVSQYEKYVTDQIEELKNPTKGSGVPW